MSPASGLAISLVSELLTADQLLRARLTKVLPNRMEISHFSVLNHLAAVQAEKTPAQLARSFHVTRSFPATSISAPTGTMPAASWLRSVLQGGRHGMRRWRRSRR